VAAHLAYWEARAKAHFAIVDSIVIESPTCSGADGKTWHEYFQERVDALYAEENGDPIPT
jgi:hypothetical protein